MENIARCYQYTSSSEDNNQVALTTDDQVTGKRPATGVPS
jgi:hypothetical protein